MHRKAGYTTETGPAGGRPEPATHHLDGAHAPLLEAVQIRKDYGDVPALQATDFTLMSAQCVGLIGENGAGKSTFAKMITGVIQPSSGALRVGGSEVRLRSPHDALRMGIALIPQELAFAPQLTVAENIIMNLLPARGGLVRRASVMKAAAATMDRYELHADPHAIMSGLPLADQQVVEIVKALGRNSRVIVLDEPTAALSERDSVKLFDVLARLRDRQGLGVVIISHNMGEIHRYADRVDVFRNGRRVFSSEPATSTVQRFIDEMLGEHRVTVDRGPLQEAERVAATQRPAQAPLLRLEKWTVPGLPGVQDVDLELAENEVVGVFGLRGSGTESLAESLAGRRRDVGGVLVMAGKRRAPLKRTRDARLSGVGYVPPDRKTEGLVLGLSVRRSTGLLLLPQLSRLGFMSASAERGLAREWMKRFGVRSDAKMLPVGKTRRVRHPCLAGPARRAPPAVQRRTRRAMALARQSTTETRRGRFQYSGFRPLFLLRRRR